MKLCKDCKHYYKTKNYDYCERKAKPRKDGLMQNDDSRLCILERQSGWIQSWLYDECGREARFFEPKEVMP